jgi:FixJ family two-component response regulator
VPSSLLIAVVDDEAAVRKAIARLLSASRLKVKTFASGQEFLDSLAASYPDCLVLDLHMPGLSGLDVQRQLARTGKRLPLVIITAYDESESRTQCLAAGAAAYLLKPLDDQALLDAIASAVRDCSSPDGDRRDAQEGA